MSRTVLQLTVHWTSSLWATVLIWCPSIAVWFTGDLSAPGGTDACLSEPLQGDGWKNRPHRALPLFSVNLQWKMLNIPDPLSINALVRCQGGLGTRPLDEESLSVWWFKVCPWWEMLTLARTMLSSRFLQLSSSHLRHLSLTLAESEKKKQKHIPWDIPMTHLANYTTVVQKSNKPQLYCWVGVNERGKVL